MEKQETLLAGTLLRMERLRQGMEQKAVCYGLCVPSYLCKIEQGTVCPDPALLSALFRRLGIEYTQDAGLLKKLRQALLDYFYRLEYGLNPQEVYASLQAQEEVLRHSPLAICWLLVQECHGEAVLPLLEKLERAMTSRQLALYRLLRCRAQPQAPEALTWCREACQSLDCSAAMMELAFLYLLRGDYAAIHRMESRLVAAAVDEGNLFQLANYFFLNATAYACLNQEAMMLTYYQRCIRLLQNTGWQQFLGDTYYNMGATYISLKQYDLSLEYLPGPRRYKASPWRCPTRKPLPCFAADSGKRQGPLCAKCKPSSTPRTQPSRIISNTKRPAWSWRRITWTTRPIWSSWSV